ncbi:Uncharacterized protein HZ326_2433 [Fusarium oxysporum f. sp. albedinis]|nr:Uncharacterized protein HZ326_2433 [Fusarium oxysporum f. sp. albedinis]
MPLPSPSSFWQLIAGVRAGAANHFLPGETGVPIAYFCCSGNEAGMNESKLGHYGTIWLDLSRLGLHPNDE